MRVIIAAIVGGIVMFAWGAVSHMFLGIGTGGMKMLPNEAPVVAALQQNINEPGLYLIPTFDPNATMHTGSEEALMQRMETGPNAFLVYHPTGQTAMSPKQLGVEFASNILAALIGAIILAWSAPSFGKRILIGAFIGLVAWLSIDVSYWDWYRFPTEFIRDELIEQVIGWFLTGAAMTLILKRSPTV
jgi:hypothetical protein